MDEDKETPTVKKNDGNERESNDPERRHYTGVINGSSYNQNSMEDETHFHAVDINHTDEGCMSNKQSDKNRLQDAELKSDKDQLDTKCDTSEHKIISPKDNSDLQFTESGQDANIYDETKPRRLKLSKIMQQDEADKDYSSERLRQSIDVLISPDEQPHRSPTRRKGVSGASHQYIVQPQNPLFPAGNEQDVADHAKQADLESLHREPGKHTEYDTKDTNESERDNAQDKSATDLNDKETVHNSESESDTEKKDNIQRRDTAIADGARRIESGDVNLANTHFIPIKHIDTEHYTNDQHTGAYMKRSRSSNDMLTNRHDTVSQVPRKTSADANLESERRYDSDQEIIDNQTQRKRRVSFGTFAYVKRDDSDKHETSPLNDELHLKIPRVRHKTNKAVHDEILPNNAVRNAQKAVTDRIPKIYLSEDDEDEEMETALYYLQNGNGNIPKTRQGCDNLAYAADETDCQSYTLNNSGDQDDANYNTKQSQLETPRSKKISTQSLPAGVGVRDARRLSWHSDDSSMPKSILKNKTVSSESLASSAGSANEKQFRVRKDSIALFTDKHGQVGLLEIKKDSKNWKERLSIKKVCSFCINDMLLRTDYRQILMNWNTSGMANALD